MSKKLRFLILFIFSFITVYLYILNLSTRNKLTINLLFYTLPELSLSNYIAYSSFLGFTAGFISIHSFNTRQTTFSRTTKTLQNETPEFSDENIDNPSSADDDYEDLNSNYDPFIQRQPKDPQPTISVPYRIIRRTNNSDRVSDLSSPQNPAVQEDLYSNNDSIPINNSENDDWTFTDYETW